MERHKDESICYVQILKLEKNYSIYFGWSTKETAKSKFVNIIQGDVMNDKHVWEYCNFLFYNKHQDWMIKVEMINHFAQSIEVMLLEQVKVLKEMIKGGMIERNNWRFSFSWANVELKFLKEQHFELTFNWNEDEKIVNKIIIIPFYDLIKDIRPGEDAYFLYQQKFVFWQIRVKEVANYFGDIGLALQMLRNNYVRNHEISLVEDIQPLLDLCEWIDCK